MGPLADRLLEAMSASAARQYGRERVTELAHALQCAELAAAGGADEELVLACLLHDVGRYAVDQALVADTLEPVARPAARPRGHHDVGADLLAPHVPARVAWLVRMHADAKRYLCAVEPGYFEELSAASVLSLKLQGGPMNEALQNAFRREPLHEAAVRLRRLDDEGKDPAMVTPPLGHFRRYVDETVRR